MAVNKDKELDLNRTYSLEMEDQRKTLVDEREISAVGDLSLTQTLCATASDPSLLSPSINSSSDLPFQTASEMETFDSVSEGFLEDQTIHIQDMASTGDCESKDKVQYSMSKNANVSEYQSQNQHPQEQVTMDPGQSSGRVRATKIPVRQGSNILGKHQSRLYCGRHALPGPNASTPIPDLISQPKLNF